MYVSDVVYLATLEFIDAAVTHARAHPIYQKPQKHVYSHGWT